MTRLGDLAAEEFRLACLRQKEIERLTEDVRQIAATIEELAESRNESLGVIAKLDCRLDEAASLLKASRETTGINVDYYLERFRDIRRVDAQ